MNIVFFTNILTSGSLKAGVWLSFEKKSGKVGQRNLKAVWSRVSNITYMQCWPTAKLTLLDENVPSYSKFHNFCCFFTHNKTFLFSITFVLVLKYHRNGNTFIRNCPLPSKKSAHGGCHLRLRDCKLYQIPFFFFFFWALLFFSFF